MVSMSFIRFHARLFVVFFIFSTNAFASSAPQIYLPTQKIELGDAMHGDIAKGSFIVANRGNAPLTIEDIGASCGCTVIDFESTVLEAKKELTINFTVDTIGKVGEIRKAISIKTNDPDTPEIEVYAYLRIKLKEHEQVDSSAIFKGDCQYCHADPAQGRFGEALFEAACYMCHGHYGLGGVARRINDFTYITTNENQHFRQIISDGIPDSAMPGFSDQHGGPLSNKQIDSLVELMRWWEEGFVFKANEQRRQ